MVICYYLSDYYTGLGKHLTLQMNGTLWNSGYTQYLVHMNGLDVVVVLQTKIHLGLEIITSTGGNFDSGQFTVSYQ